MKASQIPDRTVIVYRQRCRICEPCHSPAAVAGALPGADLQMGSLACPEIIPGESVLPSVKNRCNSFSLSDRKRGRSLELYPASHLFQVLCRSSASWGQCSPLDTPRGRGHQIPLSTTYLNKNYLVFKQIGIFMKTLIPLMTQQLNPTFSFKNICTEKRQKFILFVYIFI